MKTDREHDNRIPAAIPANVRLLLRALRFNNPRADEWHGLSDADWQEVLSFCDWANLLLCLAQLPKHDFPTWVTARLATHVNDNSLRFERVKSTYREVATVLSSAAIEHVVLKGFAQSPGYVRDIRLRRQGDIDIYCPPDSIHRAMLELQSIGYEPETTQFYGRADHLPSLNRKTDWVWHGNSFDPEMPLSLELHFCFWNKDTSYFDVDGVEAFWQRRATRQTEDLSFQGLAEVDNLAYTSLHVLRNILAGAAVVHHLYELARLLHTRARDEEFWQSWVALHDDSLRSLEAIAFSLAVSWFDCDVAPQVQAEFVRLPRAVQSWLTYFCWSPLETMFKPNKDRVWLHVNLIRDPREKLAVAWKSLTPRRIPGAKEPANYIDRGRPRKSLVTQPQLRYLLYLASRVIVNVQRISSALWRGLKWRSHQSVSVQFLQPD